MQHEYFSDSKSGGSAHSEGNIGNSAHEGHNNDKSGDESKNEDFKISDKDALILQEYVLEFKEGDTELRIRIIEKVMAEMYLLRPPNTPFDKVDAKEVCVMY